VNAGIAVGDFDRATGIVSKTDVLLTQQVGYSCTFSPDGTKLYYGRGGPWNEGWNAKPYQMDLTTRKETELFPMVGSGYSGAKLAPNGKIYWTGSYNQYLAVVENPNAAGKDATFTPQGLHLGVAGSWNLPTQTFSLRAD
jgi:streptogramin lyase